MTDTRSVPSYHLLHASTVAEGKPMALGRAHGSWFLITAHPHDCLLKRERYCLNFIVPQSSPVAVISPFDKFIASGLAYPSSPRASKPRFTIGGSHGKEILDTLLSLRSADGIPPIRVIHTLADTIREVGIQGDKWYAKAYNLCAVVEVDVPPDGVFNACARCGMWETMYAQRFLRCSGCKNRYYCSAKCQKADWKVAYHKGECPMLRDGKFEEVEAQRRLHDNGWWFESSCIGDAWMKTTHAEEDWNRAMEEIDFIYLAYGSPSPPRDAPPGTRPPRPPVPRPQPGIQPPIPPGFVRTGDDSLDLCLIQRYQLLVSGEPDNGSRPVGVSTYFPPFTDADIPPLLALPHTPGLEFTGDPLVDEMLFLYWAERHGDEESLLDARETVFDRQLVRHKREKMFRERSAEAEQKRAAASSA